jgi:ABC-type nitrate/sulfonate/bicarbonate transport system substrate-binding protein
MTKTLQRAISILGVVAAGAAFVLLAACRTGDATSKVVRASFVPAGYYLPFLVAEEDQLFQKRGYQLELTRYNDNTQMISLFLNGHLDVTAQSALTMFPTAVRHPNTVKFIYGQFANSYAFVVPTDSRIKALADLKSLTIGTWRSPTAEAFIRILLARQGLKDGADYQVQLFGATEWAPALQNGVVPVAFGFDVPMAALVQSGRFRYLEPDAVPKLLGSTRVFNGGGFVAKDLDARDPAKASVIESVLAQAIAIIAAEPARSRNILAKRLGVPEDAAAAAMLDGFSLIDDAVLESARATLRLMRDEGGLDGDLDVLGMFKR